MRDIQNARKRAHIWETEVLPRVEDYFSDYAFTIDPCGRDAETGDPVDVGSQEASIEIHTREGAGRAIIRFARASLDDATFLQGIGDAMEAVRESVRRGQTTAIVIEGNGRVGRAA